LLTLSPRQGGSLEPLNRSGTGGTLDKILRSTAGSIIQQFGSSSAGDVPNSLSTTGAGRAQLGIFRPSTRQFFVTSPLP